MTEDIELAKEWAVCNPSNISGWVHKYELDLIGLSVFDFSEQDILCWLAELMKHRQADDSKRYRVLSEKFIKKYGVDTSKYDVIKGYCDTIWNGVRQIVVYNGLLAKFSQSPDLKRKLLNTDDSLLAECAVKDTIWGIGISMKDDGRYDITKWKGQNLLGFALMEVRKVLEI